MGGTLQSLTVGNMLSKMTHTFAEVGNTSTLVTGENQNRLYLLLINDSDETMYVSHSVPAKMHEGIRVEKNGGRWECRLMDSNLCPHALYAIQSKAQTKRLLVSEGI
jgi:hypothetical protein